MTRICSKCQSTETTHWRFRNSELLCNKCYCKNIVNPTRVMFRGKRICLRFNPRRGVCAYPDCHPSTTDIHHIEYIAIMPLCAFTVELCDAHHKIENYKQEIMQDQYIFNPLQTLEQVKELMNK